MLPTSLAPLARRLSPQPVVLLAWLLTSLFTWLLAPVATAQVSGLQPFGGAQEPPDPVAPSLVASVESVSPGERFVLAIVLDLEDTWHINPSEPTAPPELPGFVPIATTAEIAPPDHALVGAPAWPDPKPVPLAFLGEGVELDVYSGRVVAYAPVFVDASAPIGEAITLTVDIGYQACDDNICLPPDGATLTLILPIVDELARVEAPQPDIDWSIFDAFDPAALQAPPEPQPTEGMNDAPPPADTDAPTGAPIPSEAPAVDDPFAVDPDVLDLQFFGLKVPRPSGFGALVFVIVGSALGGFVLNLTPCVLPVIPIKVMSLQQHAGNPARTLMLGLWMALGVVGFWLALGLPVAFLNTFSEPSQLFAYWYVTLGLGLLIAAMSLGLLGLFQITLPQKIYMINPKADNAWGSFLFGVMTAVLGLPCFGFVAVGMLGFAATLGTGVVLTVFISLGVGMALPYLILAARPQLLSKLPKAGPAGELVKQVLGLLMLAAAAYFVGSGLIALVTERPWMARNLHWWTIGLLLAAAAIWLIVRTVQITKKPAVRVFSAATSIILGSLGLIVALNFTATARENYEERAAEMAAAMTGNPAGFITSTWIPYDAAQLAAARATGHTVVVDFTAEWCANCKTLKATVLDREPVKSLLREGDVVMMTADLTAISAPGWDTLRAFKAPGPPLLVVFQPGESTTPADPADPAARLTEGAVWSSAAYTPPQVVAAIEAARAAGAASCAPSVAAR